MASNDHEVNLHSDACNDVGRDPACDYCNPYAPPTIVRWRGDCLASNLAVAGGLCAAFKQGTAFPYYADANDMSDDLTWLTHMPWRPGHAMHATRDQEEG